MAQDRKGRKRKGTAAGKSAATTAGKAPEWARTSDRPGQAIEEGEPQISGRQGGRIVDRSSTESSTRGPGGPDPAEQTGAAKDSPEQAWESGRSEAMP